MGLEFTRRQALGLLGVGAAGSMLAACSGSAAGGGGHGNGPTTKPITLTMTMWGSSIDQKTYQQRANLYTKRHPNVKVKVENIPTANYTQKVQTLVAGGSPPDILEVSGTTAGPNLGAEGAILDLTSRIKAAGLDQTALYGAGRAAGYVVDGKQYALPDRGGNIVMFYNKSMFAEANVPPPSAGWSWDQFLRAAQKTTKTKNGKTTQYGASIDDWPNAVVSVTRSFGGQFFNSAVTKAAMDSPQFRTGLGTYWDLVTKYKVSPSLADYANFGQNVNRDALFAEGKTAMIWAGVWDVPTFVQQKRKFGIVPPPTGVPGNPTMQAFGTGLAVASQGKDPDTAWDVVKFMCSVAGQKPIVKNDEDVPSASALLPDWANALPSGVSYKAVSAAAKKDVFSLPSPAPISQILDVVQKDFDTFFNGSASLEKATAAAADHTNQILAQSK